MSEERLPVVERGFTEQDWLGAPSDLQRFGPAFLARTYLVDRALKQLQPGRLLDVGCGRGNVTAIAARHATEIVATDVAAEAVAETQARLDSHDGANAFVADILAGDWGDVPNDQRRPFDCVLLSEVLEHVSDDTSALDTCHALLAEEGSLLITVPADPTLWTALDDLVGHRRRYTKAELTFKLEGAGFCVSRIISWGFPITGWLERRGATMRARRLQQREPAGEFPPLLRRLMPVASVAFRVLARIEPLFSPLDRGAGYVVLAQREPASR